MDSLWEAKKRLVSLAAEIQQVFPGLYLAGGTAIMIKYEHRLSTDLDFFSEEGRLAGLESRMRKRYETGIDRIVHFTGSDNIDFFLRGIKVSFVAFPFPNIEPLDTHGGVRLASDKDLLLNKIYVAGRRVETKDPIDIACLLRNHPHWRLTAVKEDFRKKFKDEKFEVYTAAVTEFESYPGLDAETRAELENRLGQD